MLNNRSELRFTGIVLLKTCKQLCSDRTTLLPRRFSDTRLAENKIRFLTATRHYIYARLPPLLRTPTLHKLFTDLSGFRTSGQNAADLLSV
jgi:hypothetical protein